MQVTDAGSKFRHDGPPAGSELRLGGPMQIMGSDPFLIPRYYLRLPGFERCSNMQAYEAYERCSRLMSGHRTIFSAMPGCWGPGFGEMVATLWYMLLTDIGHTTLAY